MRTQPAHAAARYQLIMQWLHSEGRVDVVDVATRLGVAQETVRRDLRTLESDGHLQRVHGGAVPFDAGALAGTTPESATLDGDLAFGTQLWAGLPQTGTILLGAGRLTLALAHAIVATPSIGSGLTLVTNSLDAAIVLSRRGTLSVYNIGGTVAPTTRAQEGDWALNELNRLHVDVSVICPAGITAEQGLSQATPAAASISEAEVACAHRVIAVADETTLGRPSFVQFATIDQVHQVAVSGAPSNAALQPFLDHGVSVGLADVDTVADTMVR